jgi:hypothetical protein
MRIAVPEEQILDEVTAHPQIDFVAKPQGLNSCHVLLLDVDFELSLKIKLLLRFRLYFKLFLNLFNHWNLI